MISKSRRPTSAVLAPADEPPIAMTLVDPGRRRVPTEDAHRRLRVLRRFDDTGGARVTTDLTSEPMVRRLVAIATHEGLDALGTRAVQ